MQGATRAIARRRPIQSLWRFSRFTNFPTGAQVVSGVEEARCAVREQIGHGADLVRSMPTGTIRL